MSEQAKGSGAEARLIAELNARADWLRSEYLHGGDFEHLRAREEECRYIVTQLQKWLGPNV